MALAAPIADQPMLTSIRFSTEDPRAQCEIMMPGLRPRRSASSTSGVTVAASSIRSRRAELMLRFLRETPVYCSSSPLIAECPTSAY